MSLIKLVDIQKRYGQGENSFLALKNIDLSINGGEFVAIMGASGSGKSTMMNILGALDKPTNGKYLLNNTDINELSENQLADFRNKTVGFIFQQFNLLKKTSVFDNVSLPGIYGNLPNLEERVVEVLERVGLSDKMKNKSNQLSGGQIQRVAVARALLMKPKLLLADEPTGNLDSKTAGEIMQLFTELHEAGNTVVLITHEDDIARYAKRKIVLKDGEIIQDEGNVSHE